MPPKTRALAISATASEKLANERVFPGVVSEVTLNAVFSPNAAARMKAAEPLTVEWPEGYSGCAGVPPGKKSSQGIQAGSESAGWSPSRIAVIGRQNTERYLPSQHAIAAPAIETFSTP